MSSSSSAFNSQIQLLKKQEEYLVNDICEAEENRKTQVTKWANILEDRIKLGDPDLNIKINEISSYIKKVLRSRGFTDGQLNYFNEFLPKKFINEDLSRKNIIGYGNVADSLVGGSVASPTSNNNESIFISYDNATKDIQQDNDLDEMSQAEVIEYTKNIIKLEKESKKRMSNKREMALSYCVRKGYTIPELEKESEDKAPENFHGQSALYDRLEHLEIYFSRIYQRFRRIKQLVYEFCPNPQTAIKAAKCLDEYNETILEPFEKMIILYLNGIENIVVNVDDSKYGAPARDWIKIALEKYTSYGSHGSGKVNAVNTGIISMTISKDGKSIILTPVDREFTREIVGDKAAKDMLRKAFQFLELQKVEQFIQIWSKETIFEEIIEDPDQFWEREKQKITVTEIQK